MGALCGCWALMWVLVVLLLVQKAAQNPAHDGRVCSTWGDFHYKTFDGDVFRFPGLCNYVFSAHCGAAYEDFNIQLRRGLVGSRPTITHIILKTQGLVLEASNGSLLINGRREELPYSSAGLLVEQSSVYINVRVRLVLTFMWNREDSALLELDPKYANQTCGLCGDFNGLPAVNEFYAHNARLTPLQFGNLQKLDGPTEQCQDPLPSPANNCTDGEGVCRRTLLGPALAQCNALVDPDEYETACIQDLCRCPTCPCATFAEYSRQCAHAGGQPQNWRGPDLCPQTCPGNMQHRECGSPCADTCSNPGRAQLCEDHCVDGCFCPPGTVLDDVTHTGCLPLAQCPCSHGGRPYAPGTSFSTACSSCTCSAGLWQCQDLPCPGTCSVQGGSHISTYDEKLYDVHGDCSYVLSKKCADSDFTVLAELRKCGLTDNENCLKAVTLNVTRGSMAIRIQANGGVFMNSIYTQLPVSAAGVTVFRPTSFFVLVETGLGLQLQVQLVPFLQVVIRLDPAYHGQMCGLCGNFNQNQADDFRTLSGVVEGTAAAFANTWKTQAACPNVKNSFEDPCSLSVENENYAQHWCSLLTDPAGAFSPCHSTVDPAPFHTNCMFDTCNCEKSEDCMCAALSSYVRACAVKGVLLRGWRAGACAKYMSSCPKSQSYTYVADGCQPTCHSLSQADITCGIAFVPVDGCTCAHGTFLDEAGACVPAEACPCYHRGSTVAPGEVVHDNGVVCSCVRGKLSCLGAERLQNTGCAAPMMYLDCSNASAGTPGAECLRSCHTLDVGCFSNNCVSGCVCPPGLVSDGSGGCVAEEDCPCLHNEAAYKPGETIRVDCNTCTCRNRRWECSRRACLATCAAYGDGHVITFDGARYSFSGDCEYTLAQDHCGGNGTANGTFRIVTENVPCGTTGVTCSKAIKLFLESYELILREGSYKVVQRGPGADPPYKVRYMGNYLAIEARSGVVVSWDRKTSVFIRLHQDYKRRICGLCGNFDGNAVNDFTTRSQSVVGDVLEFGNSWKFSPSCPDALAPGDPCTANPYRKAWAQKQCSIVHSATFATCHSQVDSTKYYEACVRDACACDSGGDCECFCTAVAAYAQACHDAGVCVSWRTPDRCPLFCDYYNPRGECEWHYQPCGAPCLRTCRNPSGRCSEDLPGLEGCYPRCPPSKPFFSEDQMKCVAQCGCYDEDGNYHDVGARVPTAENCQRCDCTPSGLLCTHSLSACTCTYEGKAYGYHDVIYNTTDGLGACLTAVCGNNGTITRRAMECPGAPSTVPFTFTTTAAPPSTTGVAPTPSTVCVRELCLWSDWYDGGRPEPGMGGGDFETFAILRQRGYRVCPAPTSVECRAQQLPDIPLQELGQKVECNPAQGLMCLNSEQSPLLCHNYELRVLCCDYVPCSPAPGVTTQEPLLTSLATPAQTTSRPGTSLWPTGAFPSQTWAPETTSTGSTAPSPKPSPTISATVTPTTSAVTTATSPSTIPLTGPQATEPGTQRRSSPGVTMAPSTTSVPSLSRGQTSPASSPHPSYVHTLVTSSMGSPTSPGSTKATALGTSPSVLPTHSTWWGTSGGTPQHPTARSVTTRTSTAHSAPGTLAGTPAPPLSTMHTRTGTPRAEMPTVTAHTTGGQGTTVCQPRCEWTEWFDVDFPTSGVTGGDMETYDNIRATGARMCPDPEKIECRAENYPEVSIDQIGQVLSCSLETGLLCRNEDQRGEFNMCFNYNIRVLCCDDVRHCPRPAPGSTAPTAPVHSSPTGTTRLPEHLSSAITQRQLIFPSAPLATTLLTSGIRTTPGSPPTRPRFGTTQPSGTLQTSSTKLTPATSSSTGCMPRCAWTDWFDEDYPTPGPNGGDFETFAVLRSAGHIFCEHPQDIECRSERAPQMALEDVGQVVQCNLSFGLVCRNREQPGPVPYCHNFHVRLLCCDNYSHCLSTPGTTEGPSPSPGTASTSVTPPTGATSPARSLPFIWASQTSTGLPSTVPGPSLFPETASTSVTPPTRTTSPARSLPLIWASQTSTRLPSTVPSTISGPSPSPETTSTPMTPTTRATSHPWALQTSTRLPSMVPGTTSRTGFSTRASPSSPTPEATSSPLGSTAWSPSSLATPSTGPTTAASRCQPACRWTDWLDSDQPLPGRYGGDIETYYHIADAGGRLCADPEAIQCEAARFPDVPLRRLGQVVQCNVDYGLICRNNRQRPGHTCLNYHIRVLCCEDHSRCTSSASPWPPTLASSASTSMGESSVGVSLLQTTTTTQTHASSPRSTEKVSIPTTGTGPSPPSTTERVSISTETHPSSRTTEGVSTLTTGTGPSPPSTTERVSISTETHPSSRTTERVSTPITETHPSSRTTERVSTPITETHPSSRTTERVSTPTTETHPSSRTTERVSPPITETHPSSRTTERVSTPITETHPSSRTTEGVSIPTTGTSLFLPSTTEGVSIPATGTGPSPPRTTERISTPTTETHSSFRTTERVSTPTTETHPSLRTTERVSVPTTGTGLFLPSTTEGVSIPATGTGPSPPRTTERISTPTTETHPSFRTTKRVSTPTAETHPSSRTTERVSTPITETHLSFRTTQGVSTPTTGTGPSPPSTTERVSIHTIETHPYPPRTTERVSISTETHPSLRTTEGVSIPTTGTGLFLPSTTEGVSIPATGTGPSPPSTTERVSISSTETYPSLRTTEGVSIPSQSAFFQFSTRTVNSASPSAAPVTTLLTSGIHTTPGSPPTRPRFGTTQPSGTLQTSSTKPTPATSSSTGCMPRCVWTDWFDEDYPTPGPNGGDFETFAVFRSAGHVFCEHPQDIECRSERAPQMALEDVGQVVQCNLSFGLVCRNREQPGPVPYCHNFHVRLLCCDNYSHCLSTPGTTEGPSPSPGTASTSVTPPTGATSPARSLPFIWASQTSTGLPSTVSITISGPSPSLETASNHTTPSTRATSHTFSLPWALQTSTGPPSMAPGTTSGPSPSLETTSILPPITVSSTGPSVPATVSPTAFPSSAFPSHCFCQAFGQIFSPGDVVYNKTDRAGCHFYAVCNQRCDIDRFEGACPTSSPPETSSPEPPPSLSPGCDLVVPRRQVNETWTLEDCTVARCEGDNHIVLLEPRQVATISCVNGHLPVKVLSEAEPCDYHLECECSCSGWGGSHYRTFDGTAYSFLHNCTHVLMREISPRHGNLSVLLSSHYCGAGSCARALTVRHKSMEIVLTTTPGPSGQKSLVMFDHTPVSHGFSKNGVSVSLMGTTAMAIDIPAIRVGIAFDGNIFQVRLPYSHFSYNTEGQCGTCTNSQADDCRRPDGTMAPTCQDMARTWLLPESSEAGCWAPTSLPPTAGSPPTMPTSAPCPPAPLCELLLSRVFAECHSLIPPSPFLSACVSDSCQADRPEVPCQSLEAYAALCRARGVCSDWRNATGGLCDFTCPPTKVYRPCGPVQPETCEPRGRSPPSRGLAEGCFCPDGSVLFSSNADVCVPQCPCVGPDGFPKFPGEQWVSNCQACVCDKGSMSVRCTPVLCQDQAPPQECSQAGFVTVTRPLADNPCCPETLCVCNRTTCPHSPPQCRLGEELTHTEEEGGCCPTFHCQPKLCTYNGTSYGIGATFPAVLPCHTCKCLTVDAQDPAVQCARDACDSTCPQGFKYSWVSGHCCGECVQVACPTPDGRLVQPNETWVNSLVDNCTEYHCEAESGRPVLTARPTPCPEVSRCRGILRKTGCCYSCEEVDSCQVRVNRMVLRHQSCVTQAPVNVTFCEGSCPGASRYSMETQAMQPQCTCCRETRAHEEAVTMQCPDGTALQHTYTHVDQCSCTPSCGPLPKAPEGSAPTSLT
ncbi:Mucin-5B [Manis pentadactyla]|nr:Mucin-5B [Manis pentadactyla]